MELADAVSEFLIAGRQCGWSHRTLGTYGWNLEHMLLWLADHDIHLVEQLDSRPIRRWGAAITEGRQAATVKGAVTTARSFLRWLRAEGLIETDLVQALKVPPVPKKIQRTMTQDEWSQLGRDQVASLRQDLLPLVLGCLLEGCTTDAERAVFLDELPPPVRELALGPWSLAYDEYIARVRG